MSDDPATRIQDAATRLFAEHGFDGVSVRDIAAAADVTVGSINYYFGSKDSLCRRTWSTPRATASSSTY